MSRRKIEKNKGIIVIVVALLFLGSVYAYLWTGRLADEAETQRLLDEVEELADDNRTLRFELQKVRDRIEDLEEERLSPEDYERMLQRINETLCDFEDIEDLESAVETLVTEYQDILEELGDEG